MKNEFVKDISKFKELYNKQEKCIDDLIKVGFSVESQISEIIYETNDFCINMLSDKYGIDTDNIFWFIFDNKFGKDKMICKVYDKEYIIDSAETFYDFEKLVEGE